MVQPSDFSPQHHLRLKSEFPNTATAASSILPLPLSRSLTLGPTAFPPAPSFAGPSGADHLGLSAPEMARIFEDTVVAAFVIAPSLHFLDANAAALAEFQVADKDELCDGSDEISVLNFVPNEQVASITETIARVLRTEGSLEIIKLEVRIDMSDTEIGRQLRTEYIDMCNAKDAVRAAFNLATGQSAPINGESDKQVSMFIECVTHYVIWGSEYQASSKPVAPRQQCVHAVQIAKGFVTPSKQYVMLG